jgi:galactonate dehydratase
MTDLEIRALDAWALREPASRRAYTVVRLTAGASLHGYGECGEVAPTEIVAARRVVLGRRPTSYEGARLALRETPQVVAAINAAMLDLVGKAVKAPVFQLLGGATRNRVRALASLHGAADEELAASAVALYGSGFRAFGVPLPPVRARNQGQAFAQAVKKRLEAIRAAVQQADLVLEGANALTPGDAASLSAELEPFHLLWFDEPCPISNLAAVRKISEESVTPVGLGRHIEQPGQVQDALREEVLDILRPDLARHGISQIRRMAALAETYYASVAPHHEGGPVGTAAALHLAASLPNFFIQNIPVPEAEIDKRMRAELTAGSIEGVKDGFASLPTGPGLGITVEEAAFEKYKERVL